MSSWLERGSESSIAAGVALFLLAAGLYSIVGAESALVHDEGLYVYGGQQLLRGVPPYASIFDAKAPIGTLLCGLGVALGRIFGAGDVLGARWLFLVLSCGCVVSVYYLVESLFGDRWHAALSSVVFLGFRGFGVNALSGPLPKTAAVLFVTLGMLFAARRRWLLAGLFAAMAGLTWQPTGILVPIVLVLAWVQSESRPVARRQLGAALAGAVGPMLALVAYFAAAGALFELLDGVVLYPLLFHDSSGSLWQHTMRLGNTLLRSGGGIGTLLLGLFMMLPLYVWRFRACGGRLGSLVRDRFAVVLLAFPAPIVWSLRDFQNYPDKFIFMPFGAIGFGWLAVSGLRAIARRAELGARAFGALCLLLLALFASVAARQYRDNSHQHGTALTDQRLGLERELAGYGAEARVLVIGAPEALVLLGRTNPTPYGLGLRPGIVRHIEARHEGGFEGWLGSLSRHRPDVVVVAGSTHRQLEGEYRRAWRRWVARYDRVSTFGGLEIREPKRP